MNSLTETDLQTYLHRLIREHLSPKMNSKKRGSQKPAAPGKQKTPSNRPAQQRGDNR